MLHYESENPRRTQQAGVCLSILGFGDELVGFVPVLQQVGGLFVIHSDVVVLKHPREEVVDLPGHIQDVAHSTGQTERGRLTR